MKDVDRLATTSDCSLQRVMLRSAKLDRAPADGAAKMIVALGLGTATAAAATSSAAAAGAGAGSGVPSVSLGALLGKWFVVGALGACVSLGAQRAVVALREQQGSAPRAVGSQPSFAAGPRVANSHATMPAAPNAAPAAENGETKAPPGGMPRPLATGLGVSSADPAPSAAAPAAPSASSPSANAARLGPQLALLEAARRAVRAGDVAMTSQLLREYRERFPDGDFNAEAAALEQQVLRLAKDAGP